ncbi:MAG: NADH-quinone oxidoreductase subunit C [Rhodobacteraceae bacterium]|nr:NADH-quinone oxidoreductase subunit C [Paracoccaceae bacterium]
MSEALNELGNLIEAKQTNAVRRFEVVNGELVIWIIPASIPGFVEFLRTNASCQFTMMIDITAVDYPEREKRFELVYHFLSMVLNQRVRIKADLSENENAPTITDIHPSANWFEREVFDMYGIRFSGHPDLRRLLTDYGFTGHPLRKDFPTTGYVEMRYDEVEKRCVYEPVSLTQEYRQFDFMSPWEGAEYILPGDEKGDVK